MSVRKIFRYYKKHGYNTTVMGASFRSVIGRPCGHVAAVLILIGRQEHGRGAGAGRLRRPHHQPQAAGGAGRHVPGRGGPVQGGDGPRHRHQAAPGRGRLPLAPQHGRDGRREAVLGRPTILRFPSYFILHCSLRLQSQPHLLSSRLQGIRGFAADAEKLETIIREKLN